jgi:hypothetical protein
MVALLAVSTTWILMVLRRVEVVPRMSVRAAMISPIELLSLVPVAGQSVAKTLMVATAVA